MDPDRLMLMGITHKSRGKGGRHLKEFTMALATSFFVAFVAMVTLSWTSM
jgi:hypothetical protein